MFIYLFVLHFVIVHYITSYCILSYFQFLYLFEYSKKKDQNQIIQSLYIIVLGHYQKKNPQYSCTYTYWSRSDSGISSEVGQSSPLSIIYLICMYVYCMYIVH